MNFNKNVNFIFLANLYCFYLFLSRDYFLIIDSSSPVRKEISGNYKIGSKF